MFDAVLEHILEAAVASNLTKGDSPKNFFAKDLVGNTGPLSNSFGKINLSYAFGFINRDQHEALHVIRDLRNEAAHCIFDFSFRDPGVIAHLKKLEKYNAKIDEDKLMAFELVMAKASENMGKFHFIVCCHIILLELQDILAEQLEQLLEKRKELSRGRRR